MRDATNRCGLKMPMDKSMNWEDSGGLKLAKIGVRWWQSKSCGKRDETTDEKRKECQQQQQQTNDWFGGLRGFDICYIYQYLYGNTVACGTYLAVCRRRQFHAHSIQIKTVIVLYYHSISKPMPFICRSLRESRKFGVRVQIKIVSQVSVAQRFRPGPRRHQQLQRLRRDGRQMAPKTAGQLDGDQQQTSITKRRPPANNDGTNIAKAIRVRCVLCLFCFRSDAKRRK